MSEEFALLREYVTKASQPAFAELVRRYVNVVYASAKRQSRGDGQLAEDVTQAVFIVLAQKAKSIPADRPLSSWLLKVTGYCASNARRQQARRDYHERRAAEMARNELHGSGDPQADWDELAPLLDQCLSRLRPADRDALLLKYFENKSLRQVGEALGISEEAAQKRVARAVDKLRDQFRRRGAGAAMSATVLAALLTAKSSEAAPATLVVTMTPAAAGGGASASAATLAKGAIVAMSMQKTAALVAAGIVLLLGIGGGAVAIRSLAGGSAHPRTVIIAPPAPIAPIAGSPRSTVTFSDGSTATVVGIAEVPASGGGGGGGNWLSGLIGGKARPAKRAGPTTWWTADGTAQPSPNLPRGLGQISAGDSLGRRQVLFIFSTRGPAVKDGGLAISIDGVTSSANSSSSGGGELISNYIGSMSNDLDRATVRLGMSKGAWREDASIAPATTTQPTTRTTGLNVFTAIREEDGRTVVEIHQNYSPRDLRVQALLKNGKTVGSQEWRGYPDGRGVIKFPCRLDQVVKIVWLSRPFEWQTLSNVALKPATTQPASVASGK